MKILVADDDAISCRMMARLLENSGYEVVTADNGREAVDMLATPNGPRLALIDWMMPELDGPEVCRCVRSRHEGSYVYITLLTSKQGGNDVVAGLEAGADDYLIKPCNVEELKARLRTGIRILDLEDKLVEARDDMRFRATHDSLTLLWNRASIIADFERELTRARRESGAVSILICDLDHFKQINDVYGHQVGDEVLQQAASRFLRSVRSYDQVGRYGGEEFLILLSGCDAGQAFQRAEDIRSAFASCSFETMRGPLSVTVSVGIVSNSEWTGDLTASQLLHEADLALYRAKASGRNCVLAAHPTAHEPSPDCETRQRNMAGHA
jgi:diguanylate cyclase (GGDEF)-like protein